MKKGIVRLISAACSLVILVSCLSFSSASADEPVGKMSSVYAYVLNDYLFTYGSMHTERAGDAIRGEAPHGIVYSDVVNFDNNENPYLVIFLADSDYSVASCHIWRYDEVKEKAERIAILDVNYSLFGEGQGGLFSLGSNEEKRYVIYSTLENGVPTHNDYYTVVKGDAFEYVNAPLVLSQSGVMDFGGDYFHSDVDISDYNRNIGEFFDNLKNAAADSVTYADISERLRDEDELQIEAVLKSAIGFNDFDIANYSSIDEYKNALNIPAGGDKFYLISEAYNLGDEIYYIRFSTDRTYYNYALLRRSDDAKDGYQILKVRTDCIPLSDRELKQIKTDYDRNTLLYKKSKGSLQLLKRSKYGEEDTPKLGRIKLEKSFDKKTHLPIVCIGGGVAIALLTILWVYLYGDNN